MFVPIIDGYVLPADPVECVRGRPPAPRAAHRRLELGRDQARRIDRRRPYGRAAQAVPERRGCRGQVYGASNDREARLAATALASNNFMGYNTWKWIETHAATGGAPAYRYLFDQICPQPPAPQPPTTLAPRTRRTSSSSLARSTRASWRGAEDRRVADLMSLLDELREDGQSERPGLPTWPAWGAGGARQLLRINANVTG